MLLQFVLLKLHYYELFMLQCYIVAYTPTKIVFKDLILKVAFYLEFIKLILIIYWKLNMKEETFREFSLCEHVRK